MAQVLGNLTSVAPGGRNAALNRANWTPGRWIAAGALEQLRSRMGCTPLLSATARRR
jgi:hypothetical protein